MQVVASVAAALVLGGCVNTATEAEDTPAAATAGDIGSREVVAVPTWDGHMGEDGHLDGELTGDADVDGGCVWLMSAGERVPVVWPRGYSALFDPIELLDEDGDVVAREGDRLEMAGGDQAADAGRRTLGQQRVFRVQLGSVSVVEG